MGNSTIHLTQVGRRTYVEDGVKFTETIGTLRSADGEIQYQGPITVGYARNRRCVERGYGTRHKRAIIKALAQ